MAYNISPSYNTDEFSFGPSVIYIGSSGTTPKLVGPHIRNNVCKTLLSPGNLNLKKDGNPEELDSRESKLSRDFSTEDPICKEIVSKYGKFILKIDKEDIDIISKGLSIAKYRVKSNLIIHIPVNSDLRFVHVMIVEKILKRSLKRIELVHHIDGNRFNCRRSNLVLMNQNDHSKLHELMSQDFQRIKFGSSVDDIPSDFEYYLKSKGYNTQRTSGILKAWYRGRGIVQPLSKDKDC